MSDRCESTRVESGLAQPRAVELQPAGLEPVQFESVKPSSTELGTAQLSSIRLLPQSIVTRIAAGEVIDSLVAVVRELVENSIDAGATRISISLWPEQWLVRVADNGQGMSPEDLTQAAQPHSTSKLTGALARDVELAQAAPDIAATSATALDNIRSLGFRGEALHSLVQLAQLQLCSRRAGETEGWQASYGEGGRLINLETVAIAPGTVATVSGLFAAWPARRQALPHPAQQLRQIQRLIQGIALAHPQITWNLSQCDRNWFSLWPGSSPQTLLPQMLRGVAEADLRETSVTLEAGTLQLLLGLPDRCHRRRPDWVKVAVNGRCIRLPELEQTLLGAMRRTLPRDRHPVAFIHIQAEPSQVDWNRHPAKAEIYLRQLAQWQTALKQAVDQALQLAPEAAQLTEGDRVQALLRAAEQGAGYGLSRKINSEAELDRRGDRKASALSSSSNPDAAAIQAQDVKALAQVHNTYIVAEHPGGLWLVEQHIAHERVLYEQICDRWYCVPLEPPMILAGLKPRQLEQLERIGVELAPFGEALWAARSAPALLAQRQDCADALVELSLGGDLQTAQVATACRSAIRNGTALSLAEMQTLLNQWQQTRQPQTCPHGRPIHMVLAETSLARFFRRHWVIGKSHGI